MNNQNASFLSRIRAWRSWRFWFGSLLSLFSLAWLIFTTDWTQAWISLADANYWLVLVAVIINTLTIPMRSQRWRLMFQPMNRPQFGKLTAIMLIGQAINVFMPARFGDLVNATLVEEEPAPYVLGTQFLRLALDTIMLAILVIFLLFQVRLPEWWRTPGEGVVIMALMALAILGLMIVARSKFTNLLTHLGSRWPFTRGRGLIQIAGSFFKSFDIIANPLTVIALVGWSVIIWAFYAAGNYILLAAVGVPATWLIAFFLLAVLLLGVAVPSSPGRVGVYHYLAVQALAVFDVDQSTAVSFAILQHLITIILPAAIGALLAWRSRVGFRTAPVDVEP